VDQRDSNLSRLETRAQHLTARVRHLQFAPIHYPLSASEQRAVRRLLCLLANVERKMAAAQDPVSQVLGDESSIHQGLDPGKAEQQVHVLDAHTATVSEVRSTDSISPAYLQLISKIPIL
jgi:hypothetical protein